MQSVLNVNEEVAGSNPALALQKCEVAQLVRALKADCDHLLGIFLERDVDELVESTAVPGHQRNKCFDRAVASHCHAVWY